MTVEIIGNIISDINLKFMAGKKNITIDDLASIIKKEFDNMDNKFNKLNNRFDEFSGKNGKEHFEIISTLNELKKGHDDLSLKLDNKADLMELLRLSQRVNIIEKKIGLKK